LRIKSAIWSICWGAEGGVVGAGGRPGGGNSAALEGSARSARSSALSRFELRNVIAFAISAARLGGSVNAILAS